MTIKVRDILLAPFPYTDLASFKLRPALVLFVQGQDITVIFITSNLSIANENDIIIQPDINNRLKKPSLFKVTKIATIDAGLVEFKYGFLSKVDFTQLCDNLISEIKLVSFP